MAFPNRFDNFQDCENIVNRHIFGFFSGSVKPGVPGVSENIRVISIVDKFLEDSRISYFQNNDNPKVFLSSADWMPRNFRRRVEILFPIEDPRLRTRIR